MYAYVCRYVGIDIHKNIRTPFGIYASFIFTHLLFSTWRVPMSAASFWEWSTVYTYVRVYIHMYIYADTVDPPTFCLVAIFKSESKELELELHVYTNAYKHPFTLVGVKTDAFKPARRWLDTSKLHAGRSDWSRSSSSAKRAIWCHVKFLPNFVAKKKSAGKQDHTRCSAALGT